SFRASHRSYPPLVREANVSGREARLDLQFERGIELAGLVVREGGVPIAGAQVAASTAADLGTNRGALTDANGSFRIEGLTPGRYAVTVRAGAMTKTLRDVDVATAGTMRIELAAGGTIAGRVTGLAPADLSTANVSVSSNDGRLSAPVRTDGTFRVEGAPPGTARVVATAGEMTAQRRTPAKVIEITAGSETYVDLDFSSPNRVSGRVLRGGAPVDAAQVSFQMGGGALASTGSARTNAQGEYVVEGLADGTYAVFVTDMRTWGSYRTSCTVAGSGTFDIEMPLASLRGRVIDRETQEGLAGASVALDMDPPPAFRLPAVQTDASGSFRLEGLAAGSYMMRASRRGYGPAVVDVVVAKDSDQEVEMRLSRVDGVAVRAVDARDGRPLRAYVSVADAAGRMVLEQSLGGSDDERLSLAAGAFRAAVFVTGYATRVVEIASPGGPYTVGLTPGGSLRIETSSRERVRARILDSSGRLLVRMRITPMPDMMIDPTGATIDQIQPGSYALEIFDAGDGIASRHPFTITEGETTTIRI
ncbi:MAG TPA: carboxypeptidase regulatory-like domain-containing protein, partial [Thermoanaerobaculia bacterium]